MNEPIIISATPLLSELVAPALMQLGIADMETPLVYRSEMDQHDLWDGRTIAIRTGPEPEGDRLAVRWLGRLGIALVATREYIGRKGRPSDHADLRRFEFACIDVVNNNTPWAIWLFRHVDEPRRIFRTNEESVVRHAAKSGNCAAFLPISSLIWSPELCELMPAQDEWIAPLWLYHDRGADEDCRRIGRDMAAIISRQLA